MKEIVTIQLGNCGNKLGSAFWEELSFEHGLLPDGFWCGETELQLQGIDCFFTNGARGRNYVPRCVLIDLDPTTLDSIRCSPSGQLYRPDNFIFGRSGSGNNFARGHFAGGREIQDITLEVIRKEAENCDWPVGFQMLGALGGGTGSGVGTLLLDALKEEYPKLLVTNYTVMPGGGFCSDAVVEPLNAALAGPSFIKSSDITIMMDNQCLYDVCQRTLKLDTPLYSDINQVMAKAMAGLSATYRFPSVQHVSWRSMKCMMIPSPKLHFFVPGYAPLNSRGVQQYRNFSVHDITYQMLHGKSCLLGPGIASTPTSPITNPGKYLTALTVYRGYTVEDKEVTNVLSTFQNKNLCHFCDWMPFHFLKSICEAPPKGQKISASYLVNHTGGAKTMWGNILKKYKGMFKRKAFLHWFYGEGCNEEDFKQAEEEIKGLIDEYKSCETKPPPGFKPLDEDQLFEKCMEDETPIPIEQVIKYVKLNLLC